MATLPVVWKKGFWAKVQPGWAWVPAQWVRQPEGWVFQDGYCDRTLEDRGTLFAPAQVNKSTKPTEDLTYQPYTTISPELYGQLNDFLLDESFVIGVSGYPTNIATSAKVQGVRYTLHEALSFTDAWLAA